MPALCLCYKVHEPFRLRRYTVFDIGQSSLYEDDDANCDALLYAARNCYLPMNDLMLKAVRQHKGAFKVAFSISGTALDQFEQYAPEIIDGFKALADTGCVEFMAETGPHSLAFLYSKTEFKRQVQNHSQRLHELFGQKPVTFRHTEFVYNNDLAAVLAEEGFNVVLAEGADHILGWRSPNYLYAPISAPKMRLLLRNSSLSEDIGLRFSNKDWSAWPLTADKFAAWCGELDDAGDIINIFNEYRAFGLRHKADSGIFDFLAALPDAVLRRGDCHFVTPSEAMQEFKAVGTLDVPEFMSWADEERDLTAWLGNDMQKDAIHEVYALTKRVQALSDADLLRDFEHLQTSDHFHYISTKWFAGQLPDRAGPFASPYDAYITYMNVLADFELRLTAAEQEQSMPSLTAAPKPIVATPDKAVASKAAAPKAAGKTADKPAGKTVAKTADKTADKASAKKAPAAPASVKKALAKPAGKKTSTI